jgi:hypothetical protein
MDKDKAFQILTRILKLHSQILIQILMLCS